MSAVADETCARCDKPIVGRRPHAIYCSERCGQKASAEAAMYRKRRARARRLVCPHCDRQFVAYRTDQTYCSPECRQAAINPRRRLLSHRTGAKPDHVLRKCLVCGAEFTTRRWNQIYCGPECRTYALNKRRIDKRRKTTAKPRVSPALVSRKAAAIRSNWTARQRRRGRTTATPA